MVNSSDYYPVGLRQNKSSTAVNINDFLFNSGSEINSYGNYACPPKLKRRWETPFRQYAFLSELG